MATTDILALDRAGSMRTFDADNRLRVEASHLTKANVCGYAGREIPGWQDLGLDADRIYQMWRHPDELEKAAGTFGGLPILSQHYPVTANDWKPDLVIGATGSEASWNAPYISSSLSIWAQPAIDGIQSREQAEISSGYRYTPDFTPGVTPDGDEYDGIMRQICGQHIAIVARGRAGPDVVVADSALSTPPAIQSIQPEKRHMAKRILSPSATKAKTALTAHLRSVLAQDADLDDVIKLLETLETNPDAVDPAVDPVVDPVVEPTVTAPEVTKDDDAEATVRKLCAGKISDEDLAAIIAMLPKALTTDDEEATAAKEKADADAAEQAAKEDADRKAAETPVVAPVAPENDDDKVTKTAMDSAIAGAVKAAEANTISRLRAAREAEKTVTPWVGALNGAFDSAEDVYTATFKTMGVDVTGVHPSAFSAVLKAQPLPGAGRSNPRIAADAATDDFATSFPNASRIRLA